MSKNVCVVLNLNTIEKHIHVGRTWGRGVDMGEGGGHGGGGGHGEGGGGGHE